MIHKELVRLASAIRACLGHYTSFSISTFLNKTEKAEVALKRAPSRLGKETVTEYNVSDEALNPR